MTIPTNLPQRANIQGFWKLNETSGTRYDETANDNDLTDNNTVLYGTGRIGKAAYFEFDVSEYLSITDALQTGLDITGEITICQWINLRSKASTNGINMWLANKFGWTDNKRCYGIRICFTDDKISFYLSPDGINSTEAVSATAITNLATWYHVAVTLNQTTNVMQIYINGSADGNTVAYDTNIADKTSDFGIGAANIHSAAIQFIDGKYDEGIVWNTCLTAAEVLAVKNISKYNYGGFSIFLCEAYNNRKEYLKKKLWLPNNKILVPEGI